MSSLLSTVELSGKAYDFAVLYNAMAAAGWSATFAAQTAAAVIGENLKVDCNCK